MKIKKVLFCIGITILFAGSVSCSKSEDEGEPFEFDSSSTTPSEWKCGTYSNHQLYTGPKGGCYYYNSSGNKTYVDRSNCNSC